MLMFKNKEPRRYAEQLKKVLGDPNGTGPNFVSWTLNDDFWPYTEIKVMDEYIRHDFPQKHYDFVYSTSHMPIKTKHACSLMSVSGSILPDLLKQTCTARCGGLDANSVTIQFVYDVVSGRVKPTKKNYAARIKNKQKYLEKASVFDLAKRIGL